MGKLPTVEVDGAAVHAGHLIPVDGTTARIQYIEQSGRRRILHWTSLDTENVGTLTVRADGTVLCVRNADWLASRGDR